MAAARVRLYLSGRPESGSFAQSGCGLLGSGPGLGPWPTHCSLRPGGLVLSDGPGASTALPLHVGESDPLSALLRPWTNSPELRGAEVPTNRSVDLGVAVILQSSDQTVLLTQRTRTFSISPNLWVPSGTPSGHVALDEEVANQLIKPATCPEPETCLGPPCVWNGEGQRKDLEESGIDLSDLHSLTSSYWMEDFENFGKSGIQLPQGQFSWVPLGLWEPIILNLLVASQESQSSCRHEHVWPQARIQPKPSEGSAFTWLGPDVAAAVTVTEDGQTSPPEPTIFLSVSKNFSLTF
ncbi:hypothetical protein MC885_003257 [Smutsia gigantea]|nr:hypothetical protein MC885_003257 [Smutsia gigantea]